MNTKNGAENCKKLAFGRHCMACASGGTNGMEGLGNMAERKCFPKPLSREADERILAMLHMRYRDGLTTPEIGRRLGTTKCAVIGVLNRMKQHVGK